MYTIPPFFILTIVLKLILTNFDSVCGDQRFYIDYEKNEFIKDGKVFRYASGSLHYFRVPRPYWRDRIRKMKAAGLNAVSTAFLGGFRTFKFGPWRLVNYNCLLLPVIELRFPNNLNCLTYFYVEWSFHEPTSGVYNFEGQADLEHFLTVLKEENMLVLIRPGPYISAERDFGGFPYWLLKEKPSLQLRSSDPNYKKYVIRWYSVLMPKIVPFLYGNEGNIIMIQIENEYGHNGFDVCDKEYTLWLRDLVLNYVGNQAQLYTTDECNISYMECGHIPNVYSTVDFSPTVNMTECFGYMKQVQKKGPLVNSEFYTGWVAYWNQTRPDRYSKDIIHGLKYFLSNNASFNLLPFHGGTNFGLTTGATTLGLTLDTAGYLPQLTSYDFKAPLDEAGDPTNKYYDIQKVLKEANYPTTSMPKRAPKGNYGTVNLLPVVSLFDQSSLHTKPVLNEIPLSFEDMDINQGLVLYETNLPTVVRPTKLPLIIETLRDRAIIFIDYVKIGTMSRSNGDTTMEVSITKDSKKLSILVENQGRINSLKFLKDKKGILSNVTLGKNILNPWVMTGYPLNDTSWLEFENLQPDVKPPAYYRGIFIIPQDHKHSKPLDTYLDTTGWSKGVAFINNINIGRYWPQVGPQITLYVPAPYLVPGLNTIVMVEFERVPEDFTVKLVNKPRLDW